MIRKTIIPHKCFKCGKQLYKINDRKNYSYYKDNYVCYNCQYSDNSEFSRYIRKTGEMK